MRRPIAIAGAVGALAIAGTAIASPGGGPLGLLGGDRDEHRAELARNLAGKLDGVSPGEVNRALGQVERERRARHRAELASGLAAQLDESKEKVEEALAKAEERMRRGFREGRPPREGPHASLARALGKSPEEVRKAFHALHQQRLERELDEAVKEGRISKERAEQIKKRFEDGPPGPRMRFRHGPGGPGGPGVGPAPGPPPGGGDFTLPAPPPGG